MPGIDKFLAETVEECEKIAVGDRVRSYDWEHRDDCYMEGIVEGDSFEWEGCPRYVINVDRHVVEGVDRHTAADEFKAFPPVNGTRHLFGGYCNGVRKV